jgi:hypothetical protein
MSEQANLAASATAADVMRPALTTVEPQAHVAAAAYLMKHAGTTALMVLATQADQPARTAAAMSARSSSFSSRFAAGSQPSTCRGDRAPTMAPVTPGNPSVQATAMAAGVTP